MVGPRAQLGGEPAALGAEREEGVVGELHAPDVVALRVEGEHRAGGQLVDARPLHGGREVQSRPAPQHGRVPGVERPGGEHAGRPETGGQPDHRTRVAQVARVVEDDDGSGPGHAPQPLQVGRTRGPHGQRGDPGGMRARHQGGVRRLRDLRQQSVQRRAHVGGQFPGEGQGRGPVDGDRHRHLGPETQGVLERVKAVEQHRAAGETVPPAERIAAGHRVGHAVNPTRAGAASSPSAGACPAPPPSPPPSSP